MRRAVTKWISLTRFNLGRDHYIIRWLPGDYGIYAGMNPSFATVFDVSACASVDTEYMATELARYLADDDVFRPDFLEGVIFLGSSTTRHEKSVQDLLESWGTQWFRHVRKSDQDSLVPGPYVMSQGRASQVWKLYDDFNKAFTVSTWPSESVIGAYDHLHHSGDAYTALAVAVPSRLYFRITDLLPLNGCRIAVKDIFHLKGVKTSCCSRSYHDLYPAQQSTATSIQTLIDLGAVVVGKLHLSSLALREEPTQCVDFQAPFNPRADGYQSPAGSSSGSGAAIASYDWLDFTLGTDTTGSGRRPALWNGCFGLRPSRNTLSSAGMVSTCPQFDSPCLFGRDLIQFKPFVLSWYQRQLNAGSTTRCQLPWTVLYPTDFLPVSNAEQMRAINSFARSLATFLNVQPTTISLSDHWDKTSPVEGKTLEQYMVNVQEHGFFYEAYHCFDLFRQDYQREFGKPPYTTEYVRWMWGIARLLNKAQCTEAWQRFDIFRTWFIDEILQVKKQRAVMILPIENLEPRYRDTPPELPSVPPASINVLYISPILGGPELTVPIAEVAYESRVTGRREYLPCAVSILGGPDTDVEVIEMIQAFLQNEGRPQSVLTGTSMGPEFKKYREGPQGIED